MMLRFPFRESVAPGKASPWLVAVVAVAVFANTWDAGFVYDDSRAIVRNKDVTGSMDSLWRHDFWGTPLSHRGSHQSYRPLAVLSFRLNHALHGLRPCGYHVTNVLLHGAVSFLWTWVALRFTHCPQTALMAGLLFAVHPVHSEAVASLVGRAELGAAFFFLLALLAYHAHMDQRHAHHAYHLFFLVPDTSSLSSTAWKLNFHIPKHYVSLTVSVLAGGVAMLWKETGITVLGVCVLYDLCRTRNDRSGWSQTLKSVSLVILATVGWLWLRLRGLGGVATPTFAEADNPIVHHSSWLVRTWTLAYLPARHVWLLLNPSQLSFDWSMDAIPPIVTAQDPRLLGTALFYLSLGTASYKVYKPRPGANRHMAVISALILLATPFLPASNLLFYVGFVLAERVLYLPSMGHCLLLATALTRFWTTPPLNIFTRNSAALSNSDVNHRRRWARIWMLVWKLSVRGTTLLLLMTWAWRTVQRNRDWVTEETLYRSATHINPAKGWANLASVLSSSGRLVEAEEAFRKALAYRAALPEAHYNLGLLLEQAGRDEEAEFRYVQAIRYRPSMAQAYLQLGLLLSRRGRQAEGARWLASAASLDGSSLRDPDAHDAARTTALYHLARLQVEQDNPHLARRTLLAALRIRPAYYPPQAIYRSLGECHQKLGQVEEAESWFRQALQGATDPVPTYLTYAKMLARNHTRQDEWETLIRRAESVAAHDYNVYMQIGQFFLEIGQSNQGASAFLKALQLNQTHWDAAFNAATALREAGRHQEAELYYRRAAVLRPQDVASHRNLGAMLHLNGKYAEAESVYRTALTLSPHDAVTLVNLQRLQQARGKSSSNRTTPHN